MKSVAAASVTLAFLCSTVYAQYAIDPNSVSNSTRENWCNNQQAECPLICLQTSAASSATESNTCDPNSLTYSCICSNGLSPNVSEYSQTLPFFICQEWGTQCVSNCGTDNTCASNCRSQHPCGALDPTRVNTSTISSTMSSTSSAMAGATTNSQGTVYTGFGGSAATSTASSSSNGGQRVDIKMAAINAGRTFGILGVMGALFGGFAVLL